MRALTFTFILLLVTFGSGAFDREPGKATAFTSHARQAARLR